MRVHWCCSPLTHFFLMNLTWWIWMLLELIWSSQPLFNLQMPFFDFCSPLDIVRRAARTAAAHVKGWLGWDGHAAHMSSLFECGNRWTALDAGLPPHPVHWGKLSWHFTWVTSSDFSGFHAADGGWDFSKAGEGIWRPCSHWNEWELGVYIL